MADPRYENIGPANVRLVEECSELIQAVCKAERFGLHNYDPRDPDRKSNIQQIRDEIADVKLAIENWERNFGHE